MSPVRTLFADATSDRFRLAVLIALASIPLTVATNWLVVSDAARFGWTVTSTPPRVGDVSVLALACGLAGYCYQSRPEASTRAGVVTAMVGGTPVGVWQSVLAFGDVWRSQTVLDAVGARPLVAVVAGVVALAVFAVLVAVLWVVGYACGGVGGWLGERRRSSRAPGSDG